MTSTDRQAAGPLEYVDARLMAWGRWAMRGSEGALGYSRRTVEGRLREEGGVLISGSGMRPLPIDPAAEEIEALVNRLGGYRSEWRRMLVLYYCEDRPLASVAHRLRVSESQLHNKWLPQAKHWLAGALEACRQQIA